MGFAMEWRGGRDGRDCRAEREEVGRDVRFRTVGYRASMRVS